MPPVHCSSPWKDSPWCLLLPILTDPCAASQHGYSATGLDLCYLASPLGGFCWPPFNLLSLLLQCPHQIVTAQLSQQSSCMSLPSILSFPVLLERLLAASPFLCSPRGKSHFILESHTERWHLSSSLMALPLSLIMISSLPAPEHLVWLICCHSPLNIISRSLVFTSLRFCPLMHHD